MLPDLRFVIGSVLATVVLGITALGLVFTVRLAQDAKSGPFQVIRPLAYTAPGESNPAARPSDLAQQPGGPFAQIPAGGSVTAQAPAAPEPATAAPAEEATAETADDHAAVDERAVVDPPLSPEGEPLPSEASSEPAAAATTAPPVVAEPIDTTGSIPAVSAAPEAKRAPAAKAKPKAKAKAKAKRVVRKAATRPAQRAQRGTVVAPTASTGYPVTIERTPNAGSRNKSGGGFPFGG
jgi:hypothetical protein